MSQPEYGTDGVENYFRHREQTAAEIAIERNRQRFGSVEADKPDAPKRLEDLTAPPDAVDNAVTTAKAVAKDVGQGVVELPRAAATGTIGAVNETLQMADDTANYINDKLGAPRSDIPNIPAPDDPTSTTGNLEKSAIQFLVGFAGAGKLKAVQSLRKFGAVGDMAEPMVKGALADMAVFDPHQANLANLVQEYPQLKNPVADFLSAKPDDSNAEGRLKAALTGMVSGAVAEGLTKTLKTLRRAGKTRQLLETTVRPSVAEGAFNDVLGNPEEPLARMSQKGFAMRASKNLEAQGGSTPLSKGDKAAMARGLDELKAPVETPETFINFSRIDAPEDVQNVMQRVADTYKKSIDTERRGVQTFEQIKFNAQQQNAWKILSERRTGQPLNAEQSVAARNLWASSATKLAEVAQLAADVPSDVNVFAFRKMLAIHQEVQRQVIGARTETARALASWRITAGAGQTKLAEIQAALATNGGKNASVEFATRLAALARNGMAEELDGAVMKSVGARTKEAFIEAWINGLLSGPKTHLVNGISNTSVIFQTMGERAVAAQIARVLGDEGSVQLGEAMALWHGSVSSVGDALRYAGKTFRTGESGFGAGKVELPRDRAISAEAMGISDTGWLGKTVDVIGAGVNVPVRALGAVDEFYKTIGYRAELQAFALRQASADVRAGTITPDKLKERVAELVDNPPESLHLDAIDAAAYRTFTNQPGKFASHLSEMAGEHAWIKFILPFVKTPANILAYSFERTPLAPLMSKVRADIKAGGPRRDIAYARMMTGTAIMLWATDLAQKGQITGRGPRNDAQRSAMQRTGWQPYSWKVGDRYYAFNRLDPIGTTLSLAADMTEILANDEYGVDKEHSLEEAAIATAMSAGNNVFNKTYLTGLANAMEALTQGGGYAEAWFKSMAGSAVPVGVAEVAKFQDPYAHAATDMIDAIYARIPGFSAEVDYRHDLWGRRVDFRSGYGGVYDAVSPIYTRRENPEPIDKEILRLEASIHDAPKATSFKSNIGKSVSVDLDAFPKAYQRYVELAGNELKDPVWRMGCKDLLNAIVEGKHPLSQIYWKGALDDGPDGGKAQFIAQHINHYRDMARKQLLKEFPDLADAVNGRARQNRERKMQQIQNPSMPQ